LPPRPFPPLWFHTIGGQSDKENKDHLVKRLFHSSLKEDRGDILIRGLWVRGTDCIIDVRIIDVDAKLNRSKAPNKVLAAHKHNSNKKSP
jgi:hypothetical protein